MSKFTKGDEITKKFLTVEEAIQFTGLSKSWLYKLVHQRKVAYSKPNNKLIYFLKSDLEAYVLSNRIPSKQEIEQRAIDYVVNNKKH